MSIETNLESIAKSLQELVEQGRLNLALKAAQNTERTAASTPPVGTPTIGLTVGKSESGLTANAPPPSLTPATPAPDPASSPPAEKPKNKGGRPRKDKPVLSRDNPTLNQMPDIIPVGPEPQPSVPPPAEPTPVTPQLVEQRDPVDDFLDSEPAPEKTYPEPTTENVRAALISYAERHGGASPGAGGRANARALMKQVTGCEVMPQLDAKVKETGDVSWYAKIIKAALDG